MEATPKDEDTKGQGNEIENITVLLSKLVFLYSKDDYVAWYRKAIDLRRIIFSRYLRQGSFSYADFIGIQTMIITSIEETLSKLPGKSGDELWKNWSKLKPKLDNRPPSDTTLVLMLDAYLLFYCRYPYFHLLEDALYLRLQKKKGAAHKTVYEQGYIMSQSIKWAETTSKRVWRNVIGLDPDKPKPDWWRRVANAQNPLRFRTKR